MKFDPSTWSGMEGLMRARYREKNGEERLGQAYFNALWEYHPEIANMIRGTIADPFHADRQDDPRMDAFYDVVVPYFQ